MGTQHLHYYTKIVVSYCLMAILLALPIVILSIFLPLTANSGGSDMLSLILCVSVAYLSGSVPYGVVLGNVLGLSDVRTIGSGNIGATNAFRTGSKVLGVGTFLCDFLKGVVPLLAVHQMVPSMGSAMDAYLAYVVILGHIFPLWLGFKGGKGVATAVGCYAVLNGGLCAVVVVVWVLTYLITRTSFWAALTGFFSAACYYSWLVYGDGGSVLHGKAYPIWICLTIILTHHQNIRKWMATTLTAQENSL